MRRPIVLSTIATAFIALAVAASTVGSGSPSTTIQQAFVTAYNRGAFASLTVTPPIADVHTLVSPALVQEFTSKADSTFKYALIMPDQTVVAPVVWQVYSDIYTYYTSLGAATVGVPTMDTAACPVTYFGVCDYQLFSKDYALFVYSTPTGLSLTLKDPFFTSWSTGGGIGAFGPALSATTTVTSAVSAVAGTEQTFLSGALFSYPNSSTTPSVYSLSGTFYSVYNNSNGTTTLGFPTSAAAVINTASGLIQQTFEGGKIQQLPGSDPVVIYPLGQINILNATQGLSLAPGATATLTALTLDSQQNIVTGRVLNWATSNGAVATVQGNGYTAIVTGVAAGSANIYVTGEGKTSPPIVVTVGAGCCAIGQGAPSQAIAAAFQAAATRNALPASTTATGTVVRAGPGYIQILDGSGTTYVIAQGDGSGTAYVISGTFYAAYLANGGFTGTLGYPVSDILPGTVQKFSSGALLAGIPPVVVPAAIAPKWLQNEIAAGSPTAAAGTFASYSGATGLSQSFGGGAIFALTSGSLTGQAFFSTGAILARYTVLLGPMGALGAPTSDVFNSNNGVLTENFEGGYIAWQPGAATAVETYNPRTPSLSLMPLSVAPGGQVHVSATGFAPGANLAFTVTGQSNFSVVAAAGAFAWEVVVPLTAKPATVAISVSDTGSKDNASGSYSIVQPADLLPTLALLSGDQQTAYPSSQLPLAVVAVLLDSAGNPMPNVPVTLSASPGASATAPAVTNSQGKVAVSLRLPAQPGVATGSIAAAGQVVTFSALATAGSLSGLPALAASGQQTTLLAAMASALLYYQNNGILPASAGAANTAALTQYLTAQNAYAVSDTGDSILNPWVAARFASGALTIDAATQNQVRDLVAAGNPAILNLNLTIDGTPAGGTSVDAIGVASDGSILISDPNPATAQTSLNAYLNGFQAQGHSYLATLASVLSIAPAQFAAAAPFTVATPFTAGAVISASAGNCATLDLAGPTAPGGVRFQYCDGSASLYELDFTAQTGATLLDLAGGPSLQIPANAGARWSISRKNGALTANPAVLSITAVTDSAAFAPALAPNQLFTIFGTGFVAKGLTVTLGGKAVQVLSASAFQINAAIPTGTPTTATSTLVVSSGGASANTSVAILATAPGIFAIGSLGAILNQDATLNSPSNPAQRGQYVSVYCTGLGATTSSGGLQPVVTAVSVIINGQTVKPLYAGAVAGFVGLYQVNVTIPGILAPGLSGTLMLIQGKTSSNIVPLALD